tara:strand:- start:5614 stop:6585 length:972 start_codon:yes stop_codon:yes gene_type:complete
MKTTSNTGVATPTVNVSVAKNRLKVYNKDSQIPTIYLEKDAEFEIELFNPTTDVIVAEIILNDKAISQGGLVLRQGERIFLERYLDVAKKFRFETYTVSNTKEVQAAIKNNGSLKVKFYREDTTPAYTPTYTTTTINTPYYYDHFGTGIIGDMLTSTDSRGFAGSPSNLTGSAGQDAHMMNINDINATISNGNDFVSAFSNYSADNIQTLSAEEHKSLRPELYPPVKKDKYADRSRVKVKRLKTNVKKTETGVVAEGSASSQKFVESTRKWCSWPFATVEYHLMPVSTKEVTASELGMRRYCTQCGSKLKRAWRFCPTCSSKA